MSSAKGNVGEYLVLAELLYRNFDAYIGNRDNPAFDIACFWNATGKATRLRVKTAHDGAAVWRRKKDGAIFKELFDEGDFVCVVLLHNGIQQRSVYIIPTKRLDQDLRETQDFYEACLNKDGSARKQGQNSIFLRFFGEERPDNRAYGFDKKYQEFLENWDMLK